MSSCNEGAALVYLASTIAIAIAEGLNAEDTNILGNLFNAIGDNLSILASKKEAAVSGEEDIV